MKKDIELISELSLLFGPSGFEGEVADFIEKRIGDFCDSLVRDRTGNLIALIRCGDPAADGRQRLMLSAHMDEVGVMITEICDDGLLRFDTVGGIDASVIEGRCMTLGDEGGRYPAIVASKAIHHIPRKDRTRVSKTEKLYIDMGAVCREEAEAHISVGSFGTFCSEFYLFGENDEYMKGKALDDRMGCASLIEIMERLYAHRPDGDLDIYFCFTVREEIGLSGARVAADKLSPDIAIVLEATAVADLPEIPPNRRVADMGKGGALSVADRSTIYDRELLELALRVGKEQDIPVQLKRYVSGGNDAGSIHKSGGGVRTLALSVPTRYLHSPSCVASILDYRAVRDLTEAIVRALGDEKRRS